MKTLRTLLIYFLLIGGSLLFVWPFLWMAATSAKLDRELFGETLQLWPQRPIPRLQSPYVDDRLFADLRGPRLEETLAMIEADLAAVDYSWPNDLDRAALQRQTARAVYARLLSILPGEDWELPAAQLHAQVTPQISPGLIAELVAQLRRGLLSRRVSGAIVCTGGRRPRPGGGGRECLGGGRECGCGAGAGRHA